MQKVIPGRPKALSALPGLITRTSKVPSLLAVHKLRTTIRRVETALKALPEETRPARVLKRIGAIRRSAGRVRDLDVHINLVQRMKGRGVISDLTKLTLYLTKRRRKREEKLLKVIDHQIRTGVLEELEETPFSGPGAAQDQRIELNTLAAEFVSEARKAKSETTLHSFRLKCKHLRYSAELLENSTARTLLINVLKQVQKIVGEWHDLVTLKTTAEKQLGSARPLVAHLRTQGNATLNEALRIVSNAAASVEKKMPLSPRKAAEAVFANPVNSARSH